MNSSMPQQSPIYTDMPNTALSDYFRHAGDMLTEESALLGGIIRNILATGEALTNKALILQLIGALESTSDVVRSDVIRKTLEIVVDHTLDDL
ncbi:Biofilm development protein YmgB/AriR [Enterobacter sp. kpr-6]|nr:Biofilm development protein YmgB/AriR [Enterobacter sp. kpr-6]